MSDCPALPYAVAPAQTGAGDRPRGWLSRRSPHGGRRGGGELVGGGARRDAAAADPGRRQRGPPCGSTPPRAAPKTGTRRVTASRGGGTGSWWGGGRDARPPSRGECGGAPFRPREGSIPARGSRCRRRGAPASAVRASTCPTRERARPRRARWPAPAAGRPRSSLLPATPGSAPPDAALIKKQYRNRERLGRGFDGSATGCAVARASD